MRTLRRTTAFVALLLAAYACSFLVGKAYAQVAPAPKPVGTVTPRMIQSFKTGYRHPLSCSARQNGAWWLCRDPRGMWILLFRPSRCIIEIRATLKTTNYASDARRLLFNPTVRKTANICGDVSSLAYARTRTA